jgi:hypothetical protein
VREDRARDKQGNKTTINKLKERKGKARKEVTE